MGLNKDLHLKGNNFSDAATAFYIAFLITEIPNGMHQMILRSGSYLSIFQDISFKKYQQEMAVIQRHRLGNHNRMFRSNQRLPRSPHRQDIPRHVRSLNRTIAHAD
jgi:hypothetical protein